MIERGVINHRQRAKQLRDFSGLKYGKITPTDIDGLIEYKNKGYVIIELKYGNTEVQYGQMLALERLCDDLQKHKKVIVIIAKHMQSDTEKDIDTASAIVEKYRYEGQWKTFENQTTVKRLVDSFLKGIV